MNRFRNGSGSSSLMFLVAAAALVLATGCFVPPASADSITLSPDIATASLSEGQSLTVHYAAVVTVTTAGAVLTINTATLLSALSPSGDPTDLLTSGLPLVDTCLGHSFTGAGNGTAANTCTMAIVGVPVLDSSIENADFGTATFRFFMSGTLANGFPVLSSNGDTAYTVSDVTAVPEPSGLVLLGSGLLGLAGAVRRKLLR